MSREQQLLEYTQQLAARAQALLLRLRYLKEAEGRTPLDLSPRGSSAHWTGPSSVLGARLFKGRA